MSRSPGAVPGPHDPDLERAQPGEAEHGSFRKADADALVRLRDGSWGEVQVIGWRRDRRGRWCCLLRYYQRGVTMLESWYVHDPEQIKPLR